MVSLSNDTTFDMRSRFLLKDVIELRGNGWVGRKGAAVQAPKPSPVKPASVYVYSIRKQNRKKRTEERKKEGKRKNLDEILNRKDKRPRMGWKKDQKNQEKWGGRKACKKSKRKRKYVKTKKRKGRSFFYFISVHHLQEVQFQVHNQEEQMKETIHLAQVPSFPFFQFFSSLTTFSSFSFFFFFGFLFSLSFHIHNKGLIDFSSCFLCLCLVFVCFFFFSSSFLYFLNFLIFF